MVSHHFVSQLVLFALIWLVVILHLTRPKRPVTGPATSTEEPEPLTPKRHRSNAPQPFEGLTHKPQCALCERDTASPQAPSLVPPDPMPPTNRRPREIDHLTALLSTCRLCLPRLAWAGQSARQRASQWRPLASVPLYLVQGLLFGDAWHHLPRHTDGSGADCTGLGVLS
jgi:hypothetical protein